jgi:conserved oligomeric Golgi complex subunit 8
MHLLTSHLIAALRAPNIKLATAMRTIGWLRRVAPELDEQATLKQQQNRRKAVPQHTRKGSETTIHTTSVGSGDGALGALFLVCRLASLNVMLEALEPLRELAEQETSQREQALKSVPSSETASAKMKAKRRESDGPRSSMPSGQQTERYLKRYIEIFREQSFAIVSMYKSIFPAALPAPSSTDDKPMSSPTITSPIASSPHQDGDNAVATTLLPLPSPLATFPAHLTSTLFDTLRTYMSNVTDPASRDSLLTQVLYCAGSLGRLGGDFSMMLAVLEEELAEEATRRLDVEDVNDEVRDEEWVKIVKKHRVHASRLELLASGVGQDQRVKVTADG